MALLIVAMCCVYCVLRRRLRKAQIVNERYLNEARAAEQERVKAAEAKEIEVAAKQKRVLKYIQDNLIVYPNDERKVWNTELEEQDCGIC